MATRAEVREYLEGVLNKLDSMAQEAWIAEGFVIDILIVGTEARGFSPDIGTILYTLDELGERQLSLDFEKWHSNQTEYKLN